MRAMVIYAHGGIDEITFEKDYPTPQVGAGEVLVRVRACTLNAHDLFTLKGMPGIKINMPVIMGIDIAGEVEEVGAEVEGLVAGDRVVIDPIDRVDGGLIGETVDGGLAEYVKVPAHVLVPLDDDISFLDAAALPCAYGTAYRMMVTRGRIENGEKVLILGASGGVGTCCVQLASSAGATVIAAASSKEKLEKLKALGADEGINYREVEFHRAIQEMYGKPSLHGGDGGVDVIINYTGGDTWVPSLKCLAKDGRMLTCGATAGFNPVEDIRYIWTFEHNIIGSNGWSREDLLELLKLTREGKLNPVVEKQYALEDTREAFSDLEERRVFGKIAIVP